ncbi:MAG: hypothetical protein P8X89_24805 [Reinekea sp.]
MPYPVVEALKIGELVIVRVEPTVGEIFNTNIFGFTVDGHYKWRIEESPHGTEADKPFTSISVSQDNQLIAGNWNGVDYVVDVRNGTIKTIAFNK